MTSEYDEWEVDRIWESEFGDIVQIRKVEDNIVHFSFLDNMETCYHTSKGVFKLFYERLEPEEEGLLLLSRL